MRKLLSCGALLLAGILLALGIYHACTPDAPLPTGNSSASLGLVLLEKENGLYVLAVTQDSPADRADIRPGDYLLRAETENVTTVPQLDALIAPARESIHVLLRRDGRELQIRLPIR